MRGPVHACVRACMHARACARARVCVCVCVCVGGGGVGMCVRVCVRARASMCARLRVDGRVVSMSRYCGIVKCTAWHISLVGCIISLGVGGGVTTNYAIIIRGHIPFIKPDNTKENGVHNLNLQKLKIHLKSYSRQ